MRRKYKMTGCARFLIFLLIFTPLVLIGVSIYNGNNPIDQVKELLNIETTEQPLERNVENDNKTSTVSSEGILKSTIETQKETIQELRKEISDLKEELQQKDRQIQLLQGSGNE
ncbi:hypothetical protein [Portibacter marinus]|uniref:hypothetical protein n=1 Tax=Portibacter marinus TaxID=2898660 RepID=UPI001F367DFF|nr:hypothetical protein [Portibacter marinus]